MQLFHFIACVNSHTYRHTLLYFYEITCGIVNRNQRERTTCSIADTLYYTCVFHIRNSIRKQLTPKVAILKRVMDYRMDYGVPDKWY